MKKKCLLFISSLCFVFSCFAQTTYYWRGSTGTAVAGTAWATATNWTTNTDGSADAAGRATPAPNDILVVDGNILQTLNTSKNAFLVMPKDACGTLNIINGTIATITNMTGTELLTGSIAIGAAYGGNILPVTGTGTAFATELRVGDCISGNNTTAQIGEVVSVVDNTNISIVNDFGITGTTLYRIPTLTVNTALNIDATSQLLMGHNASGSSNILYSIYLPSGAIGNIYGTVAFQRNGCQARIVSIDPGSLIFKSGSFCTITANPATISSTSWTAGPFFGSALGTGNANGGTPAFTYNTNAATVHFEAGSTYRININSRIHTPFGRGVFSTTPLVQAPVIKLLPNSNYITILLNSFYASIPYTYSSASIANYGNVYFLRGLPTAFSAARVDSFIVGQNSAAINNTGSINVYGDVIDSSTNALNFGNINFAGNALQTIKNLFQSGPIAFTSVATKSGLINNSTSTTALNLGNLTFYGKTSQQIISTLTTPALQPTINSILVADSTTLLLNTNQPIKVAAAFNNNGFIDFGTNTIDGSGTGTFNNNPSFNKTYNIATPATTGFCTLTNNSNALNIFGISTVPIGSTVTSSSHPNIIPVGTYIKSYSSGGNYTLSNAALATVNGESTPALSLTFKQSAGTVTTPQAAGLDASLLNFTAVNSGNNSKYVFNTATTTPFHSLTASPVNAGSVTINANTTLNKAVVNVSDSLVISSGILTIPVGDTLRITSGKNIGGAPFSNTKFIETKVDIASGTNMGVLHIEKIPAAVATLFPVGTNGNYLPVTITTNDTTSSFAVTAFNGATNNGLPNGTPIDAARKDTSIDASFLIGRVYPSNDITTFTSDLKVEFPASLMGAGLATVTTGLSHYNGSTWDAVTGSSNLGGTTTIGSFTSFSPFLVAKNLAGTTLPVAFGNISASLLPQKQVQVKWNIFTEINTQKYIIERSTDGVRFNEIGYVLANNSSNYNFIDAYPFNGKNYYRIASIDNGSLSKKISNIVRININDIVKGQLNVYPNPVINKKVNVEIANLKTGFVTIAIYNNVGQMIYSKPINYSGNTMVQTITLPSTIKKGIYQLQVSDGVTNIKKSLIIAQ